MSLTTTLSAFLALIRQHHWLHRVDEAECVEGLRRVGDSLHLGTKQVPQADWMAPLRAQFCAMQITSSCSNRRLSKMIGVGLVGEQATPVESSRPGGILLPPSIDLVGRALSSRQFQHTVHFSPEVKLTFFASSLMRFSTKRWSEWAVAG